jgi:hypothetical protein
MSVEQRAGRDGLSIRHGCVGQFGGYGRQDVGGIAQGRAAGFGQRACLLKNRQNAPRFGVGLFGAAQSFVVFRRWRQSGGFELRIPQPGECLGEFELRGCLRIGGLARDVDGFLGSLDAGRQWVSDIGELPRVLLPSAGEILRAMRALRAVDDRLQAGALRTIVAELARPRLFGGIGIGQGRL